jgi:Protein of unknown function (DUF3309)
VAYHLLQFVPDASSAPANFAREYSFSLEEINVPMSGSAQKRIARAISLGIAERCSQSMAAKPTKENQMGIGTILLVILVLALVGVIPTWPHSREWGYGPSGGVGLILVIVLILFVLGKI